MTISSVRIALLALIAFALVSLSGCATRGYVDRQYAFSVLSARNAAMNDTIKLIEPTQDKVDSLETRIKFMERKTEAGRAASAKTKEEIISDKIRTGEAIDNATENYRQILRDFNSASIEVLRELAK